MTKNRLPDVLAALIAKHGAPDIMRALATAIRSQAEEVIEDAEDHAPSCDLAAAMNEIADCLDENSDSLEDADIEYNRATA